MLSETGFLIRFLREPEREARPFWGACSCARGRIRRLATLSHDRRCDRCGSERFARRVDRLDASEVTSSMSSTEENEAFYRIPSEHRPEIAYHRNSIIHLFVPEALLAMALLSSDDEGVERGDLEEETFFLSRLFKYEWIYEERSAFGSVFERRFDISREWSGFEGGVDRVEIKPGAKVELEYFRRMILSFLEAYVLMARQIERLREGDETRDDLVNRTLKEGKRAFLRGDLLFYEPLQADTRQCSSRSLRTGGFWSAATALGAI